MGEQVRSSNRVRAGYPRAFTGGYGSGGAALPRLERAGYRSVSHGDLRRAHGRTPGKNSGGGKRHNAYVRTIVPISAGATGATLAGATVVAVWHIVRGLL